MLKLVFGLALAALVIPFAALAAGFGAGIVAVVVMACRL